MKFPKLVCLAAIVPAGLVPVSADASFYTGTQLYDVCTVEKGDSTYLENAYECIAYITGAVDAFNTKPNKTKSDICLPTGMITINDLRTATVEYLSENPEKREESASSLVFAAARVYWPCVQSSSSAPSGKAQSSKARSRKAKPR